MRLTILGAMTTDPSAPEPPDPMSALAWFADLSTDNTRDFWAARRDEYTRAVRDPFEAMIATVDAGLPRHEGWRIHRPFQDARFAPGGLPLKTHLTATAQTGGGSRLAVVLDADGLSVSSGIASMTRDQIGRWRAALCADDPGAQLVRLVEGLTAQGYEVTAGRAPVLRRVPPGVDPAHPRALLLRWKGAEASARPGRAGWLDAGGRAATVATALAAVAAVGAWLDEHVGPPVTTDGDPVGTPGGVRTRT